MLKMKCGRTMCNVKSDHSENTFKTKTNSNIKVSSTKIIVSDDFNDVNDILNTRLIMR